MTLKKIADIAGVSVSTVSKAFSGSREISPKKREYIFEIAKKAGCYDKYCKSSFGKKVIAVICPEFQGGYYSEKLTYFAKEIEKRDSVMVAGCYSFNKDSKEKLISYFTESAKVDGLIILGADIPSAKYSTPILVIGESENSDSISLSLKNAIDNAIECLLENGHRDIAFIGEKLTEGKFKRFETAMSEKGIKINTDYVVESEERFERAGYSAMNKLLAMEKPPTAVVAAYDHIAIGAMKSIYEHGFNIPDDISLIGMDDIRETSYLNVSLTSITSYSEELCEIAVGALFERMKKGNNTRIKKINVASDFVERKSVGKAKR